MVPQPALAFIDSPEQLLVIFAIFAFLFGASRLPQLGSAMGKTIRNFKEEMRDGMTQPSPAGPASPRATRPCGSCGHAASAADDAFCARCGRPL